jgi:hypothetical protein
VVEAVAGSSPVAHPHEVAAQDVLVTTCRPRRQSSGARLPSDVDEAEDALRFPVGEHERGQAADGMPDEVDRSMPTWP